LLGDLGKGALAIKPPVFSGGGASSADCGGVEATALMNGGWLAAAGASLPLALQPARPIANMQRAGITPRLILESEVI